MEQTAVRIAGEEVTAAASGESVEVVNPDTREAIAEVPLCGPDEVDRACRSAAAALERGDFPQHERARVLERAADQQPYGGVRDAGDTREGPADAVRDMTELRFVSLR